MRLKQIIKIILNETDIKDLTLADLKDEIKSFLHESNISEAEVIVRESNHEVLYLNDYHSLDMAIWECIQQSLVH